MLQTSCHRQELQDEVVRLGRPRRTETTAAPRSGGPRSRRWHDARLRTTRARRFLRTIEAAVGRERFDVYLRSYFDRHAFQPIDELGVSGGRAREPAEGRRGARWQAEASTSGSINQACPTTQTRPSPDAFAKVARSQVARRSPRASRRGDAGHDTAGHPAVAALPQGNLPKTLTGSAGGGPRQDVPFHRAATTARFLFSWLRIRSGSTTARRCRRSNTFLTSQGRRKFLKPLYEGT